MEARTVRPLTRPGSADGGPARTGPRGLTGWQDVCRLNEIRPGRGRPLVFNGTDIALFRDGETVYALGGTCPHRGGPLGNGTVVDGKAVCPLHLRDFDLQTGISPYDPADRVPTYRCRVVDDMVQLDADSVPAGPGRPDSYLGKWARRGADDRGMRQVHHLAAGGSPQIEGGSSQRGDASGQRFPGYDDLAFKPAQLARPPLASNDVVETATVIGSRADRPLRLAIPLLVSHLSYGAISIEAKVALARGAREVGTAIGSGDGGVHGRERDAADKYIVQLTPAFPSPGRGQDEVNEADAIEIKIGEGGRPGIGGHLAGFNVTTEVSLHRDVPFGADVNTPAHFVELPSLRDLKRRIDDLRERGGGVPIGVKIAAGDIEADLAAALEIGADYITLDGFGAGSGASPVHIKDHVGIPSVPAIFRARRWLERNGVDDVQLIASGGFRTPDEMAKALALGADAVAVGTAALLAIGCQQYRACHRGTCPVGIATQEAELRLRLNPDISGHRLATFLRAATAIIGDYCRVAGRRSVADLRRTDLVALTPEVATVTDLPYLG